ncbi:hypothetical protein A5784_18275 [Mycobacterium sp. 852013-50091_SCH5140682]|nr:hypothetical protein A5784_18275 [Mycobacterium sp. 852013-50091_SCH5140682]
MPSAAPRGRACNTSLATIITDDPPCATGGGVVPILFGEWPTDGSIRNKLPRAQHRLLRVGALS